VLNETRVFVPQPYYEEHHLETCHSCGLPADCISGQGRKITIEVNPENGFQRRSKRTVWVHCDECAYQAFAIAKYGMPSRNWPVTLAEFRQLYPLPPLERSNCPETISETRINSGAAEGLNEKADAEATEVVSGRRKGGRPRKWSSEAQRKRAYRQRTADAATTHPQHSLREARFDATE